MPKTAALPPDALHFATQRALESWLRKNHASSDGVWLLMAKAGAENQTVTYAEALEAALCHGWIDGQKKGLDAQHWHALPEARTFFAQLDGANRYAVLWRVQTAKTPQARSRRIETLVAMLARGEKIHG